PSSAPPASNAIPGSTPTRASSSPDGEFERALEGLAGVVRLIGRYAVDTPEVAARQVEALAEHWSQHLLIRQPKPGDDARSGPPSRDYRALVDFVTQQRRQESTYLAKALCDLRQTVWAFIQSVNRAVA